MASIKRKSSGGGGANWMDTYGDMVTLLLCFFVLLYSMSNVDQAKWSIVVDSFKRNPIARATDPPDGVHGDGWHEKNPGTEMTPEEVQAAMEELYERLKEFVELSATPGGAGEGSGEGSAPSITVSKGDGYVFISFNDAVFFDGDSYVLRQDGKNALDAIVPMLTKAGPFIDELRVLGHTAQAASNRPNNPIADRTLAANRSTAVLLYIQEHIAADVLDPARLVGVQYGQWRPISPNDTQESRMQNRRVELIIAGRNVQDQLSDSIRQYYSISEQTPPTDTGSGAEAP